MQGFWRFKCHLKSCNGDWESKVRVQSLDARDSGRSTFSLRGRILKGCQRCKSAAYLMAKHAQFGDQDKIWLAGSVYLLESDVLMFEWKYWLLSLASKKKKRISSVLILSVENPLVSQWTMYHCILTLIFRIAWLALQNFAQQFYRFSSYNESLWKRDWSWLYNWKASQLFYFFGA